MAEREQYTGVILPRFWEETRHLSVGARMLAAYLTTSARNAGVPGYLVVGVGGLADELNVEPSEVEAWLVEIQGGLPGFLERDKASRVIRLPRQAEKAHRPNHKVLAAWWRAWLALPASPLKVRHIESLRRCLSDELAPIVAEAWASTFGTVAVASEPVAAASPTGASTGSSIDRPTGSVTGTPTDGATGSVTGTPTGSAMGTPTGNATGCAMDGRTGSAIGRPTDPVPVLVLVSGRSVNLPEAPEQTSPRVRARSQEQGPGPSAPAQVALLPEATATTTTAGVTQLRQVFCAWFLERYARPYAWDGTQAGKAKTLLQRAGEGGVAEIMRRAQRAAAQDWRDTDVDLGTVLKGWNALASDASARASPPARDVRVGYVPVTGTERFRDGVVEDF